MSIGEDTYDWLSISEDTYDWLSIGEDTYDWLNIGEDIYEWLKMGEEVYDWLNNGEGVFDWMSDMGGLDKGSFDQQALLVWLSLGEEIENAGVNGADDDGDSGGGTFSACALVVLSDKGSTSLRINSCFPLVPLSFLFVQLILEAPLKLKLTSLILQLWFF